MIIEFGSGSATSRYPLSRKPCFRIGGQLNSLGDIGIVHEKSPFVPYHRTFELSAIRFNSRTCNTRFLRLVEQAIPQLAA